MPDTGWIQPISWQLPTPVPQSASALKAVCQRTLPQPPTLQLSPLSHLSCTWMRSLSPSPAWYAAASIPACCRLSATVSHSFLCSLKCNCKVTQSAMMHTPPSPHFLLRLGLPATASHSFLCSLKCNCSHPVCHDTYTPPPPPLLHLDMPATVSHSFLCSLKCNHSHTDCHDAPPPPQLPLGMSATVSHSHFLCST